MVDITAKTNTLRIAIAQAVVKVSSPDTIKAIQEGTVPKGDVFEIKRSSPSNGIDYYYRRVV